MDVSKKIEIIKSFAEEIVTEEELVELFKTKKDINDIKKSILILK